MTTNIIYPSILFGFMIIFLAIMIFFIVKNKKLKSHKSYTNILYSGLAFLVFIVCFLFIAGTTSMHMQQYVNLDFIIEKDIEKSTYNVQVTNILYAGSIAEFEFSIGNEETFTFEYQENDFTLSFDGDKSFTLGCEDKTETFIYDETSSDEYININFLLGNSLNIPVIIIISILGLSACLLLIFGTYKSQYVLDVKRQIKAEESGQVIEKYNQNIQVTNGQPQAQNEYKEEKTSETQASQTRVIPPLPPEIKAKLEQNKKEDDTQ